MIGAIIQEEMAERGWGLYGLCKHTGLDTERAEQLLDNKLAITNEIAELLAKAFDTSSLLWQRLAECERGHNDR